MTDVVRWVDTQEVGEVAGILERADLAEALHAAQATWCRDERTRSSVYTTAETVLAPFAHEVPTRAGASAFEPEALLGGANTLFLCAPAHDQRRLRGYFTTITQQVLAQAFAMATRRRDRSIRRCWSCSTRQPTSRRCPSSTAWPPRARRTGSSW